MPHIGHHINQATTRRGKLIARVGIRGGKSVRRNISVVGAILVLAISAFGMLGAGPNQGGLPPQPFLADYFSGRVFIQGAFAPFGTMLVACVDDCQADFESVPVVITGGGEYRLLEINPDAKTLRGRNVTFYLVNEHGRIKAEQASIFEGAYNISNLVLTFAQPMPTPAPVPTPPALPALPAVGDTAVPQIPKLALALGTAAAAMGMFLLVLSRRGGAFQ
jgi:hypothetical protein